MKLNRGQLARCDAAPVIRSGIRCGVVLAVITVLGGCSGQTIGTPLPAAAVVVPEAGPNYPTARPVSGAPTPDCTDTVRATLAIHTFLNNYNAGKLSDLLNQFSDSFSGYEDGRESFMGVTLTDAQQHLTQMFARHDHLTAPDDSMNVQVETGQQTIDYYVTLNNVTRHSDSSTRDATGSIVIGLDCISLKVNAIAFQMR